MKEKNKQRLFSFGKVILFFLMYIGLILLVSIIYGRIFSGERFYDQLPVVLLQYAVGIFAIFLFVKIIDKENFILALGLSLKNHVKEFFVGGLVGVICIIIGFLTVIKLDFQQVEFSNYWIEKIDYFLIGTLLVLCSAIMEEIIFRGKLSKPQYL